MLWLCSSPTLLINVSQRYIITCFIPKDRVDKLIRRQQRRNYFPSTNLRRRESYPDSYYDQQYINYSTAIFEPAIKVGVLFHKVGFFLNRITCHGRLIASPVAAHLEKFSVKTEKVSGTVQRGVNCSFHKSEGENLLGLCTCISLSLGLETR